jgi:hypothetical protein
MLSNTGSVTLYKQGKYAWAAISHGDSDYKVLRARRVKGEDDLALVRRLIDTGENVTGQADKLWKAK